MAKLEFENAISDLPPPQVIHPVMSMPPRPAEEVAPPKYFGMCAPENSLMSSPKRNSIFF
jgi:hypothetical protein